MSQYLQTTPIPKNFKNYPVTLYLIATYDKEDAAIVSRYASTSLAQIIADLEHDSYIYPLSSEQQNNLTTKNADTLLTQQLVSPETYDLQYSIITTRL